MPCSYLLYLSLQGWSVLQKCESYLTNNLCEKDTNVKSCADAKMIDIPSVYTCWSILNVKRREPKTRANKQNKCEPLTITFLLAEEKSGQMRICILVLENMHTF